jgi:hypothetical protein
MQSRFLETHEPIPGLGQTTVADFWRWAYSDVLSNINRSTFAEFMVARALVECVSKPRVEWESVDLLYRGFGIEVKASAYCQSWHLPESKASKISFSVRKARAWDKSTLLYVGEPIRSAQCFVFCFYPEKDCAKANVLDVPAWDFYVMPTSAINEEFSGQKSVSLEALKWAVLKGKAIHCKFDGIKPTVDGLLGP